MPDFRFNTAFKVARGIRAFFDLKCGFTRGSVPAEQQKAQAWELAAARERLQKQRRWLDGKNRRIERLQQKSSKLDQANKQMADQLKAELSAMRTSPEESRNGPWAVGESEAGVLPDYLIIGTQKGGTTYLYHLLCKHPYVAPAAEQEVHYFDSYQFKRGTDWYRTNFPPPSRGNGQKIVTGESSPYYIYHPRAAQRAAKIVPKAKLIALLRNPADRAYSDYQQRLRLENETLSFEEAIDAEEERLHGEKEKLLADGNYYSRSHRRHSYLARGVYVDQLMEWHRYFDRDQLLVLKSEDFFERPKDVLNLVTEFLDLPAQDVDLSAETNDGGYKGAMSPDTRRRLEEYFEPHNQRLYDYLGKDFGW